MQKIGLLVLMIFWGLSAFAQDISGIWTGKLQVQGTSLRLVFTISKTDSGYRSTLDSPDQGAKGIPVTSTSFENSILKLEISNAGITYEGTLSEENTFVGSFKQGGQSFPMVLTFGEEERTPRPQEPVKPYPYHSEEVKFKNDAAGIELAGTLTLPQKSGSFPAVILISGSGPQNRDQELAGHKPFLVLADFLTRNGIAVLRFDERGVGESTGVFGEATTYDFAADVQSAIDYLLGRAEINKLKIGLIGHSEGGIVAPIVGARSKEVSFMVLMAGSALRGDQLLLLQKAKIERQMGINEALIAANQEIFDGAYKLVLDQGSAQSDLKAKLSDYFTSKYGPALPANQKEALVGQLSSPWMLEFVRLDPADYLAKVTCSVLAINGSKDIQVPSAENLGRMKAVFEASNNSAGSTKELEGLNHLFQECETGATSEYSTISQTISPLALNEILDWIKAQVK